MNDQFFIDPYFSAAMQLVAYGSLGASILLLLARSRWALFFGGTFLATADPRFATDVGGMNPLILGLYAWAFVWALYLASANARRRIDTTGFLAANRLGLVLLTALGLLAASIAGNAGIAAKSFVLIFLPYFALVPFGIALAHEGGSSVQVKLDFLRGLQVGYAIFIALARIFAPGEVTGALGDISVSATIVAIMCSYGILITIHLMRWSTTSGQKFLNLALLALFAVSAVQTLSRGPLVAILIAAPLQFLMLHWRRFRRSPGAALRALAVLGFLAALVIYNADYVLQKRNVEVGSDLVSAASEQFLSSRYNYILGVVDFDAIPLSSLMSGQGLGASEEIARSLGIYRIETFWLEAAYDVGIVGTVFLFVALARNAWSLARREAPGSGSFGILYASLFLFTLFLSPSSFGWFLQGHTGFVYVAILMLACGRAAPRPFPAAAQPLIPREGTA
jgi:hypothetical protein